MVDKDLRQRMAARIEEGEFGVGDLPDFLDLFCQVCNDSPDVRDEVKGWNRKLQLRLAEGDLYWLAVRDGAFTCGKGALDGAELTLAATGAVAAGIFCGEKDATSAYMSGALKVEGQLPDAVKLRTLIGIVREEVEG